MGTRSLNSGKVTISLSASVRNTMLDAIVASGAMAASVGGSLADGAEANQANRGWQWKNKTLASAASITIDLYDVAGLDMGAGNGLDVVGQALAFEEIVAIIIKNENVVTDETGQLEIIPAAVQGWSPIGSHTVATGGALRGQGVLCRFEPGEAGLDVNDGVSHQITLTANGGAVVYSVWLLGRHDDDVSSSSSSSSQSSSSSSQSVSSSSSSSSLSSSLSSSSS